MWLAFHAESELRAFGFDGSLASVFRAREPELPVELPLKSSSEGNVMLPLLLGDPETLKQRKQAIDFVFIFKKYL